MATTKSEHMKPQTNRQKQAAATKAKIFDCAIALFAENAYERVSVGDICKRAGVSVGAFYHHFGNKENILNVGYRLFDEQLEQTWSKRQPGFTRHGLELLIGEQMRSMREMGAPAAAQYFKNQLSVHEKYIVNRDRFFYRTVLSCVQAEREASRLTGDTQAIADDLVGLCRGVIYDWCLHEGGYNLEAQGLKALEMVLGYYAGNGE